MTSGLSFAPVIETGGRGDDIAQSITQVTAGAPLR
jgi:hypothetical protein